jgi:hypothetical protein
VFLAGGEGLKKPLRKKDTVLQAAAPWTLSCWIRPQDEIDAPTLVAGIGETTEEYPRYLALDRGKLLLWVGKDNGLAAPVRITPGKWHFLAATFDGRQFHLFSDGAPVASGELTLGSVGPLLQMAPVVLPGGEGNGFEGQHFGGKIASFMLLRRASSAEEVRQLYNKHEDFPLVEFEEGSKPWPIQTREWAGYRAPQDPSEMPYSKAPFSLPVARPLPPAGPALKATGENQWSLDGGWYLTPAPKVKVSAEEISRPGFRTDGWWPATVPGTVLTTMIDRGVYPDPDYGLNNLAIPESLNKQEYWYRTEFQVPRSAKGRHLTLTFLGTNYKAQVWMNGRSLGAIKGAFVRGVFDVTGIARPGERNALAVRISPPPHPGIPQEQSVRGGPGVNGGIMCLDGPTFVATEGWDWVPAIRDRDTGIWQPVTLTVTDAVKIGDPQVVTTLPLPDTSRADVEIHVPLENTSGHTVQGRLTASFEHASVGKSVTLPPGTTTVDLTPAEFAQLAVQHPRLWWPNGYGSPELYHLTLTFAEGKDVSDVKRLHFGIREITYELSLFDSTGHLRRVEYSPTTAHRLGQKVVDVTHNGIRPVPVVGPPPPGRPEAEKVQWRTWVVSFTPGGLTSSAIRESDDMATAPYLVIKVNGVRIACRGGNWGMDDSRKRVSRGRLEPYFRLHRDAHINIIRNWQGQDTEGTFYDLADEYGLLVWNDFWESTQDSNLEAEDPQLFLQNARDTILRFRNHPSIVVWCGRNEGVPQPIINRGLDKLVRTLDGTRYYSPSSNQVNLQGSGPYQYQDPRLYYTRLDRGFSVENGTPSMPTLESFRNWVPGPDQWPIDDVWAYHDWHQKGLGDVAPFMNEVQAEFGAPTSLADFERKAQLLNYVDHRAIFEGMNAHLWAPNSGRLLWMTQPAWPSTMWQVLSSDYDTQASFYGVMEACEPVHVQLDLSNYEVDVVNTTIHALSGLTVISDVYSLDNTLLLHEHWAANVAEDTVAHGGRLDLARFFPSAGVVLVHLQLKDPSGKVLSHNLYWLGANSASYRKLTRLPKAPILATATANRSGDMVDVHVQVRNTGATVALENKLTLQDAKDGARILPAYYSDNYLSLLPGEAREIEIQYPAAAEKGTSQITIRGWDLSTQKIAIKE